MPDTEPVLRGRGRPPTGKLRHPVTYMLPPDLIQAIEVAAQARRTTKTAIVEAALKEYLSQPS